MPETGDQRGIAVAEVILGPGESGRTADRPSFVRLLSYCKAHRKRIGYVIVESLSRFARNVADQGAAIAELRENGIALLSVAEPNVDNTAAGRMAAGVHGVFNQYFSDALSEKMKERSAASVRAGRWPWAAPIGYVNDLKQATARTSSLTRLPRHSCAKPSSCMRPASTPRFKF